MLYQNLNIKNIKRRKIIAKKTMKFELIKEMDKRFNAIIDYYGIKTETDALNFGITFLEWAMAELKNGRGIASVDEKSGKYCVIDFPGIESEKIAKPILRLVKSEKKEI